MAFRDGDVVIYDRLSGRVLRSVIGGVGGGTVGVGITNPATWDELGGVLASNDIFVAPDGRMSVNWENSPSGVESAPVVIPITSGLISPGEQPDPPPENIEQPEYKVHFRIRFFASAAFNVNQMIERRTTTPAHRDGVKILNSKTGTLENFDENGIEAYREYQLNEFSQLELRDAGYLGSFVMVNTSGIAPATPFAAQFYDANYSEIDIAKEEGWIFGFVPAGPRTT